MAWFAIRSVYLFAQKSDGTNVFEERVVAFEAPEPEAAHKKAEVESEQYAQANDFEVYPERDSYRQDGEPLIDGYELWSELFEPRQSLAEFYESRYSKYDYHPE